MAIFDTANEDAIFLSRKDPGEPLGTYSDHSFQLEDLIWPTAEHYFQAARFDDDTRREKVRLAASPGEATSLGKPGLLKSGVRKDWDQVKINFMTRALYTKFKTHPEIAERLLATGNETIVENDQYDYFWGCGRDKRGENQFGKLLMSVRQKLKDETKGE